MAVEDATIADLLARARQAHLDYRRALPGGPTPNPDNAQTAMQLAYDLRLEAEALDPNLTALAFRSEPEKFTHSSIMQFYREQLAR